VILGLQVPAKINLHLQIVGRRPDGFHELRTLLHSVDLFDRLTVEAAPDGHLSIDVDPPGAAPFGDDNLVLRAARRMWRELGRMPGGRCVVRKAIPTGGGMGGASADAAGALLLLDRLWDARLGGSRLLCLAAELGSDVPFFLVGGLALGFGRGAEVCPLPDLPPMGVVVLMPEVEIATAAVYGMLEERLTWCRPEANVYAFAAGLGGRPRWEEMFNDLQSTVSEGWPVIGEALACVRDTRPLHLGLSGSGSSVFGLYPDRSTAARAGAFLGTDWRVHVGETLARADALPEVRSGEEVRWK
jgi:4-diphosphocytidyl-2-C-methyl-D-erythritol kinase